MAEQTIEAHCAAKVLVVGSIVARAHRPITAIPGVPAHRHFEKLAIGRPMKIAARMIAGPDHVVDFDFDIPSSTALKAARIALLEISAVALQHCVGTVRRAMRE